MYHLSRLPRQTSGYPRLCRCPWPWSVWNQMLAQKWQRFNHNGCDLEATLIWQTFDIRTSKQGARKMGERWGKYFLLPPNELPFLVAIFSLYTACIGTVGGWFPWRIQWHRQSFRWICKFYSGVPKVSKCSWCKQNCYFFSLIYCSICNQLQIWYWLFDRSDNEESWKVQVQATSGRTSKYGSCWMVLF